MLNPRPSPSQLQRPCPQVDAAPVVYVVDDDVSVRESMELMIRYAGWEPRLLASARDFLAQPVATGPSCLLLDVRLPDLNGLDLQARIAGQRPDMPIIFLTGYGDVPLAARAMKAGAVEVLTKPWDPEVLLLAIADALAASRALREVRAKARRVADAHAALTRREQDVMAMVVAGALNKQIAAALGISEVTVKAHRGRVMRKMGARTLPELVKMAELLPRGEPVG